MTDQNLRGNIKKSHKNIEKGQIDIGPAASPLPLWPSEEYVGAKQQVTTTCQGKLHRRCFEEPPSYSNGTQAKKQRPKYEKRQEQAECKPVQLHGTCTGHIRRNTTEYLQKDFYQPPNNCSRQPEKFELQLAERYRDNSSEHFSPHRIQYERHAEFPCHERLMVGFDCPNDEIKRKAASYNRLSTEDFQEQPAQHERRHDEFHRQLIYPERKNIVGKLPKQFESTEQLSPLQLELHGDQFRQRKTELNDFVTTAELEKAVMADLGGLKQFASAYQKCLKEINVNRHLNINDIMDVWRQMTDRKRQKWIEQSRLHW